MHAVQAQDQKLKTKRSKLLCIYDFKIKEPISYTNNNNLQKHMHFTVTLNIVSTENIKTRHNQTKTNIPTNLNDIYTITHHPF